MNTDPQPPAMNTLAECRARDENIDALRVKGDYHDLIEYLTLRKLCKIFKPVVTKKSAYGMYAAEKRSDSNESYANIHILWNCRTDSEKSTYCVKSEDNNRKCAEEIVGIIENDPEVAFSKIAAEYAKCDARWYNRRHNSDQSEICDLKNQVKRLHEWCDELQGDLKRVRRGAEDIVELLSNTPVKRVCLYSDK